MGNLSLVNIVAASNKNYKYDEAKDCKFDVRHDLRQGQRLFRIIAWLIKGCGFALFGIICADMSQERTFEWDRNPAEIGLKISARMQGESGKPEFRLIADPVDNLQIQFVLGFFAEIGKYRLEDQGKEVARMLVSSFDQWKGFMGQRLRFSRWQEHLLRSKAGNLPAVVSSAISELDVQLRRGSFTDDDADNPKGPLDCLMVYQPVVDLISEVSVLPSDRSGNRQPE